MKQSFALLFCFLCFLALCSCEKPQTAEGQETYSRIGSAIIDLRIERVIPFGEAYAMADLTATVEIEELVDTYVSFSHSVDLGVSVFSAKIIDNHNCNVDGLGDTVYIVQAGLSSATIRGYPLFKSGDVLLLNLYESTGAESKDYDNIFCIINSPYGIMQVNSYNGEDYVINRSTLDYISDVQLEKIEDPLIINDLLLKDTVLSEAGVIFNGIFDYDTFVNYMEELK